MSVKGAILELLMARTRKWYRPAATLALRALSCMFSNSIQAIQYRAQTNRNTENPNSDD